MAFISYLEEGGGGRKGAEGRKRGERGREGGG